MIQCSETDEQGKHRLCCEACGLKSSLTKSPPNKYIHTCKGTYGYPGTALRALLIELGVVPKLSCNCGSKVRQMNEWGVSGCEQHFEEICGWLRAAKKQLNWTEQATIALSAVTTGVILQTNPLDIIGSLVRLAIDRAK